MHRKTNQEREGEGQYCIALLAMNEEQGVRGIAHFHNRIKVEETIRGSAGITYHTYHRGKATDPAFGGIHTNVSEKSSCAKG